MQHLGFKVYAWFFENVGVEFFKDFFSLEINIGVI